MICVLRGVSAETALYRPKWELSLTTLLRMTAPTTRPPIWPGRAPSSSLERGRGRIRDQRTNADHVKSRKEYHVRIFPLRPRCCWVLHKHLFDKAKDVLPAMADADV